MRIPKPVELCASSLHLELSSTMSRSSKFCGTDDDALQVLEFILVNSRTNNSILKSEILEYSYLIMKSALQNDYGFEGSKLAREILLVWRRTWGGWKDSCGKINSLLRLTDSPPPQKPPIIYASILESPLISSSSLSPSSESLPQPFPSLVTRSLMTSSLTLRSLQSSSYISPSCPGLPPPVPSGQCRAFSGPFARHFSRFFEKRIVFDILSKSTQIPLKTTPREGVAVSIATLGDDPRIGISIVKTRGPCTWIQLPTIALITAAEAAALCGNVLVVGVAGRWGTEMREQVAVGIAVDVRNMKVVWRKYLRGNPKSALLIQTLGLDVSRSFFNGSNEDRSILLLGDGAVRGKGRVYDALAFLRGFPNKPAFEDAYCSQNGIVVTKEMHFRSHTGFIVDVPGILDSSFRFIFSEGTLDSLVYLGKGFYFGTEDKLKTMVLFNREMNMMQKIGNPYEDIAKFIPTRLHDTILIAGVHSYQITDSLEEPPKLTIWRFSVETWKCNDTRRCVNL